MRAQRALGALLLAVVILAASAAALSYDVSDARFSVSTFDGAPVSSAAYASGADFPSEPATISLDADNVVKFALTVTDSQGSKVSGAQIPHQAWVVLGGADKDVQPYVWPLRLRTSSASATWSMVRGGELRG